MGPTVTRPVQDPLAESLLDNRLYMNVLKQNCSLNERSSQLFSKDGSSEKVSTGAKIPAEICRWSLFLRPGRSQADLFPLHRFKMIMLQCSSPYLWAEPKMLGELSRSSSYSSLGCYKLLLNFGNVIPFNVEEC